MYRDFVLSRYNLLMHIRPRPDGMKKDSSRPDIQSAETLIKEAQAARVRAHVRAILSRLYSRALKPSRETE
jgi:hypothetical protein